MAMWALLSLVVAAGPDVPSLNWVPRSDWVSAQPAAVGDGVADDTAALQAKLSAMRDGSSLFLPPGTYRLTRTLTLDGPRHGILLIGAGRGTRLVWDGESGGRMFRSNGVAYSRYIGLTWDGRGKAAVGFEHAADQRFETEVRHEHEAFRNFTAAGIRIGHQQKVASAEILYFNCLFEQCGTGVAIGTFNDYDNSFDGCEFRDCGFGITDSHGNFYARNCHFEGSRQADCRIASEHGSSLRWCTSLGSQRFVTTGGIAPVVIQDCRVSRWRDAAGALHLQGAPVLLFDCVFSDPPAAGPPVRAGGGQKVMLAGNTPSLAADLVAGGQQVVTLPAGRLGGALRGADQSLLRSSVDVGYRVFDAKRDFGARGDGQVDDTEAIQKAIDAARDAGHGALAYLPSGAYKLTRSLRVSGGGYRVGGSGFITRLLWRGPADGVAVEVVDPQDVTLEQFRIGHHDDGPVKALADIRQTSTGGPSRVTYDGVYVYGLYQKQPGKQGLLFERLSKDSLVVGRHVQGNLRFVDCGRARFLFANSLEGTISVSGKAPERDGLLGFLFRLATVVSPSVEVRDNHSLVMSDFYTEQMDRHLVLAGSPGDPPGRVTIQGPKMHTFTQHPLLECQGYTGQVFLGSNQFYIEPKEPRLVTRGEGALTVIVAGHFVYNVKPRFELAPGHKLVLLANQGLADTGTEDLSGVAAALDDLRRLAQLDREVNGWR